jgi:hypothetical protein
MVVVLDGVTDVWSLEPAMSLFVGILATDAGWQCEVIALITVHLYNDAVQKTPHLSPSPTD